MSATAIQCKPGRPCEVGRYRADDQERMLVGRRIDGVVHVFDYPADGKGRRYFVEAGFDSKAELAVLLADYRRQANRLGACPMSREAIERAFVLAPAEPIPPQVRTP